MCWKVFEYMYLVDFVFGFVVVKYGYVIILDDISDGECVLLIVMGFMFDLEMKVEVKVFVVVKVD